MTYPNENISAWYLWFRRVGRWLVLIFSVALLWWTFRQIPLKQVWAILQQLETAWIVIWLGLNAVLVIVMSGRWWLILRALGHPVPYLKLIRYRLASFAVSYFTPGPQFGGEPLQVLALRRHHQIPVTVGTASVSLDRLLEMIANFTFLVFGISFALLGTWFPGGWQGLGLLLSLGLLGFPLAYLVFMLLGLTPLRMLVTRMPRVIANNQMSIAVQEVEGQMSRFCVGYPQTVLTASLVSLGIWVGLIFEYWLLTRIVGLNLSFLQAVSALVAARLALLTPLPGGLGALEASQVVAFQILGFEPSIGGMIALLVRMRDLFFGFLGLSNVVSLLGWRTLLFSSKLADKSSERNDGV
jgi:uncharacterized protein (TIRG00374 family)